MNDVKYFWYLSCVSWSNYKNKIDLGSCKIVFLSIKIKGYIGLMILIRNSKLNYFNFFMKFMKFNKIFRE